MNTIKLNTKLANNSKKIIISAEFKKSIPFYIMLLLPIIYLVIFCYAPMYGIIIAFKDFQTSLGVFQSKWVGLANFERFFGNYNSLRLIFNTVFLSIYSLIVGFVMSMSFAILLNSIKNQRYKKLVQTVSYAPNFISVVIIVGIINRFFDRNGIINNILTIIGLDRVDFLSNPAIFPNLFVWSGIWQSLGFSCIIFLGVLSSVDVQLHEVAMVDGASMLQRIRNIDIPALIPTAIIMLIINMGSILSMGHEKVLLMQNSRNISASEILSTYVYKVGVASGFPEYSFSTAIGFFQALVGLILVLALNRIAKKVSNTSLW